MYVEFVVEVFVDDIVKAWSPRADRVFKCREPIFGR
jgi:hypothetical protein